MAQATKTRRKQRQAPPASFVKQERKSLLRCLTCGSVDDGKSTLIGRLLYESQLLYDDQLASLKQDSQKYGTQNGALDFALLVDGLAAEREQGITIDVAYRFFSTKKRKFIIADTPGHEQYTRNMATGASTATLAILLLDARKGVLQQTRRHAFIVSLLGIRHIVLTFNKMDLINYARPAFDTAVQAFTDFAKPLGFKSIAAIPISALHGDNIVKKMPNMRWYKGPTLLAYLETIRVRRANRAEPFAMPVQWVARPHADFRGFSGQIAAGTVRPGDDVMVLPSRRQSRIQAITTLDEQGSAPHAQKGQSVMLTLADELDISRGDMLCDATAPLEVSNQLEASIVWMAQTPMLPGRSFWLKLGCNVVSATITTQKYTINVNTLEHIASKSLQINDIGVCTLALDRPIAFAPYAQNRSLGSFILIDKDTNTTSGAGMVQFGLQRAQNIQWQELSLDKSAHAAQKGQKPAVLWFTGLSGAGKSTIANELQLLLYNAGKHSTLLDGDNVRHGLNKDLGFKDEDRVENIRRVGEVAKLMTEAGLIVLVSFISPFQEERASARAMMDDGEFLEVFIDTSLAEAQRRDPKGLYKKARAGKIKNFTAVDSPYEPPQNPDIHIKTKSLSAKAAARKIFAELQARHILP